MRNVTLFLVIVICIFHIILSFGISENTFLNNQILTKLEKHDTTTKIICDTQPQNE